MFFAIERVFRNMIISGKAVVAGICGWPVFHSRSPIIHNYWIQKYGIDGAYVPFPISPENLESCFNAIGPLGIAGLNVTVPHKEKAFQLMDEVDEAAQELKAVNTIFNQDGRLLGTNTDAFGFFESLRESFKIRSIRGGRAVLLGAGGAARSIVSGLLKEGVNEVLIVNRTLERAEILASDFGAAIKPIKWSERSEVLDRTNMLINTTSLGMEGQPPLEISLDLLDQETLVYDIVYVPLETSLLRAAKDRGNPVIGGIDMLLHQARPGFRGWFGRDPEVDMALRNRVLNTL